MWGVDENKITIVELIVQIWSDGQSGNIIELKSVIRSINIAVSLKYSYGNITYSQRPNYIYTRQPVLASQDGRREHCLRCILLQRMD